MELTYDEAMQKLEARYTEYPELGAIAHSATLEKSIADILSFNGVDVSKSATVVHDVRVVLGLYAPVGELAQIMTEDAGLTPEQARDTAQMIESILLAPVYEDLLDYDYRWQEEAKKATIPQADSSLKEKLELRPEGVEQVAKPLTREELLNALSSKRTMASDMARVQQTAPTPTPSETSAPATEAK